MPRARRSGAYMSPAAVRIRSDVAMPTPISTSPASSAGTDDVRVASAFNAHPLESATNPTASTGRRPCRSIVRPAITAVTPDDVRKMAGPRPSSPAWPVTSTNVSVETAAASCSTTELTALVVDRSSVFRRITGARSVVICTNPRTGRRIIASEGMPEKASAEIAAAGRTLVLSNPAKTFFPERGETKLDLANYYVAIEQPLMRALGGRPVLMERYPDGAGGSSFFQKRVPKNAPDWLQTTTVQTPNGTPSQALVAADVAHIVWAVNLGCIGLHVWPYLAADPDHTDELRIDLDPSPGVDLVMVKEAATETRALLDELGIEGHPKTTGRNGIHVYVRLRPEQDSFVVREAAVALARELERRRPDLTTAAWWKEERGERVFVDFNQNAPHKTVIGAWTVRPRPGAQVSMPFAWDELEDIDPQALTLATAPASPTSSSMPRPRALSAVSSITVVAAATVALLADGGQTVLRTPGATSGPSPSQTPAAPNPATGTIAYARHAGGGMFGDAGGPVVEVTPDGAVVGRLPLQHTCCLTQSTASGRFAVLVAGAGPLRLMSTGGGFTYPIPLPTGHTTLRLTPGAWS